MVRIVATVAQHESVVVPGLGQRGGDQQVGAEPGREDGPPLPISHTV